VEDDVINSFILIKVQEIRDERLTLSWEDVKTTQQLPHPIMQFLTSATRVK
jgi:hypothetical protein